MAEYGHCPRTTPGMGMGWRGGHCCLLLLLFSEILSSGRQQVPPGNQRKLSPTVELWNLGSSSSCFQNQNYILFPCSDAQESIISMFHVFVLEKAARWCE